MPVTRTHPWAPRVALLAVLSSLVVAGCTEHDFPDRTARVVVDGKAGTFKVDSCGRDDRTVFVVARAKDGTILQGVVGLRADRKTAVPRASGFTLSPREAGSDELAAFGPVAWDAKGEEGTPPGEVTAAAIKGSRIQMSALAQAIGDSGQPTGTVTSAVTIDARCDLEDD